MAAQLQVPISEDVMAKLKAKALLQGKTLRELVNQILAKAVR
jgi:predicted HicB family RNase H-like nuclease